MDEQKQSDRTGANRVIRKSLYERFRDNAPSALVKAVRVRRWSRYKKIKEDFLDEQAAHGRYAFIHINKCGGVSIEKALSIPTTIHDSALERRARIGVAQWEALFSFSVVRHPLERLASHYRYSIKINWNGMGTDPPSLEAFIEDVFRSEKPRYIGHKRQVAPCHDWLADETGRILVDYVGRLESIDTDWPEITARIGVDVPLPHRNATVRSNGDPAVISPETRKFLRDIYASDLAAFGYDI